MEQKCEGIRWGDKFCWYESVVSEDAGRTPEEAYQAIVEWAARARSINPLVFDEVSDWIRGAEKWDDGELETCGKVLMEQIIGRFLEQSRTLQEKLEALKGTGIVNLAVFEALENFERELSGKTALNGLQEAVTAVFRDFSALKDTDVREKFAGGQTGPEGTDEVEVFGYINQLKVCDAAVQWTLFMPDFAARQQNGFWIESFVYQKYPALRFIGVETDRAGHSDRQDDLMRTLDGMAEYRSGFDYDVILYHHFGRGVDVEPGQALAGRFMAAGTPVPEGAVSLDFTAHWSQEAGLPYIAHFAFARFAGDLEKMHGHGGYDVDAMYDVTRNVILGQNVPIPYPEKYWTAEVFLDGFGKASTGFLFSVNE